MPLVARRLRSVLGQALPRLSAAREAVAAWRQLDDRRQLYLALARLAFESANDGDLDGAGKVSEEAAGIEDSDWPPRLRLLFSAGVSRVIEYRGDAGAYRDVERRNLALAELAGAGLAAAFARFCLADAASTAGDFEEAVTLGRAVVAEQRTLVRQSVLDHALTNLCGALLMQGDIESAGAAALEAWPTVRGASIGWLLDHIALLATRIGRYAEAARILGRAEAWYAASRINRLPNEARSAQLARVAIEMTLEASEAERLFAAGEQLTDGQIDALVRSVLAEPIAR